MSHQDLLYRWVSESIVGVKSFVEEQDGGAARFVNEPDWPGRTAGCTFLASTAPFWRGWIPGAIYL